MVFFRLIDFLHCELPFASICACRITQITVSILQTTCALCDLSSRRKRHNAWKPPAWKGQTGGRKLILLIRIAPRGHVSAAAEVSSGLLIQSKRPERRQDNVMVPPAQAECMAARQPFRGGAARGGGSTPNVRSAKDKSGLARHSNII